MIKGQYRYICDACGEETDGEGWSQCYEEMPMFPSIPAGWWRARAVEYQPDLKGKRSGGLYCPKHTVTVEVV